MNEENNVMQTGKIVTGALAKYVDANDYLNLARAILTNVGNLKLIGESVSGDMKVYAKVDGKLWYGKISDLEKVSYIDLEVPSVRTYGNKCHEKSEVVWRNAVLINHGKRIVYEVTTEEGRTIEVTDDHSLFTKRLPYSCSDRSMKEIFTKDLGEGSPIVLPAVLPIETEDYPIEDTMIHLCGFWLADGSYDCNGRAVAFSADDENEVKFLYGFAEKRGVTIAKRKPHQTKYGIADVDYRIYSTKLVKEMQKLDLTYPKHIPNWVFLLSNRQIRIFLDGYLNDGTKYSNNKEQISCINREVLLDLQTLYLRLGLISSVSFKGYKGAIPTNNVTYKLNTAMKKSSVETIFRRVKSVKKIGEKTVYDFSVLETQNFIANNILAHNTGTGKTHITHALDELMKLPFYEIVLTSDISRYDLLATDVLRNGQSEVRDGIVLKWLKNPNGGMLYIDGCNYGQPSVFSLFECLADFRGSVYIPELEREFKRTKNHYLVISFNPAEKRGYAGTFIQNIATMRRFEGLIIDYLEADEETKIVKEYAKGVSDAYDFVRKFVEIANKTRELYRRGKLNTPLTTGNLINYAKLYKAGLDETKIIEIAKSLYPDSQWTLFTRLFEDSKPLDINELKRNV